MDEVRKADDGKSSGALFSGIAGDSMQQVVLCSDWCASTGKTRIHHLTRKDPEEVTSSTGKRSAGKLACCVWKGGKSVSSYLSLHKPRGGQSVFDDLKQGYDRALDIEQIMAIVRSLSPKFEPGASNGTKAHYADTNYQLLGAIIESVTGKSIADNFQEMIFTPLNLKHTYLYDAADRRSDQTPATIYYKEHVFNLPGFFSSKRTDGGIFSTVCENLVFLRAFFDGKLFAPTFFDRMMRRWNAIFFPMQYGYGMMRFKPPRVFSPFVSFAVTGAFQPLPVLIGHSGSTGSFAYYCPEKALYLAGTVNQITAESRPFQLMIQIANALQ